MFASRTLDDCKRLHLADETPVSVTTGGHREHSTTARPVAVIVQQGKVLDYIDGVTQRAETPEE